MQNKLEEPTVNWPPYSRPVPVITLLTKLQQCHIVHRLPSSDNVVQAFKRCGGITQCVSFHSVRGRLDPQVQRSFTLHGSLKFAARL